MSKSKEQQQLDEIAAAAEYFGDEKAIEEVDNASSIETLSVSTIELGELFNWTKKPKKPKEDDDFTEDDLPKNFYYG